VRPPSRTTVGDELVAQVGCCALTGTATKASTASTKNHLRKSAISFSLVNFEFELMEVVFNLSFFR
jgi:hypothetical protein